MSETEHVLEYGVENPLGDLHWVARCSCGWKGRTPGIKMLDSARLRLLAQHHTEALGEPGRTADSSI